MENSMKKRIITTDVTEEDVKLEGSLRPQRLEEYIGQKKTKDMLKIYIAAAKQRGECQHHDEPSRTPPSNAAKTRCKSPDADAA